MFGALKLTHPYFVFFFHLVCPLCLPQFEKMMDKVNSLQNRLNNVEKEKVCRSIRKGQHISKPRTYIYIQYKIKNTEQN